MIFTDGQIKDMQELFRQSRGKKMDSNAIIDMIYIANSVPPFKDNIKFKFNDTLNEPGFVDIFHDGRLYIGMGGINEISSEMVRDNDDLCKDPILAYNYWIAFFVNHELYHLHQYMEAFGITSYEDPRVSNVYQNIFKQLRRQDPVINDKYERLGLSFSHERNANMEAAETMYAILGDTDAEELARINHLAYIASGYRKNKHLTVVSPVFSTYRMIDIANETSMPDLSFRDRFYHGLDITEKEYNFIFNDKRSLDRRDYPAITKRLSK